MFKFWNYKSERDELHRLNTALTKEKFDLASRLVEAELTIAKRDDEIKLLKLRLEEKPKQYFPNPSTEDPSPMDSQERAAYLSTVVTFFENIGVKKINQLAAKAREDLSNPLNGREYDLAIKGTINAFAQMLDWYDECFAELNQPKQDKVNQNN